MSLEGIFFLDCNIVSSLFNLPLMYLSDTTVGICALIRAFLFMGSFSPHFLYPAVIYMVFMTTDLIYCVATSRGFWQKTGSCFQTLLITLQLCPMPWNILFCTTLYMFHCMCISQGLTSIWPWQYMNAISCFSDTNHIQVFENVPWLILVN